MNMPTISPSAMEFTKIEPKENTANNQASQADAMKSIRKARLQRQTLQDPSMIGKLVAMETTPVYNAKGDIVQAVSGSSLEA